MVCEVYVGVLVLLVYGVDKGNSISCYSCSSKSNESCYKPDLSQLQPVHCDTTSLDKTKMYATEINSHYRDIFDVDLVFSGDIGQVCLKAIIKDGNKDYILRGCQLAEQRHLDICKRLRDMNTDILRSVYCSKCSNEDGCNSTPETFNFNLSLALMCIVACKMLYNL